MPGYACAYMPVCGICPYPTTCMHGKQILFQLVVASFYNYVHICSAFLLCPKNKLKYTPHIALLSLSAFSRVFVLRP